MPQDAVLPDFDFEALGNLPNIFRSTPRLCSDLPSIRCPDSVISLDIKIDIILDNFNCVESNFSNLNDEDKIKEKTKILQLIKKLNRLMID